MVRTKIIFPNARILRFPIDIRGKKYIRVGAGFTTGVGCRLEAYPRIAGEAVMIFGENIEMNDYVHITAMQSVTIGNNVLIASKVYISDCVHGSYKGDKDDTPPTTPPRQRAYSTAPVIINDNVWIGENVCILPGVNIGYGTIIGANSVVSRSLPANVIAVGAPATPIKVYNVETTKWEKFNF